MMAPKTRYDSLDAWRGLACLMVVIFHSTWGVNLSELDARVRTSGGSPSEWALLVFARFWIGVPLFFVISGYCIAASADASRDRPKGGRRYFVRRLRRIYPPLMAALILASAIALLTLPVVPPTTPSLPLGDPRDLTASQWLGNLTLTEEWRPDLGGSPKSYLLGQTWTLCYEEQFYVVIGVLILMARRWFFPGICIVTTLVLLNLMDLDAIVGRRLGINLNVIQVRVPGLFINGLWITFAAGVAVYYLVASGASRKNGRLVVLVLLGFAMLGVVTDPNLFDTRQTLTKFLAVGCLYAVMLYGLHPFDGRIASARCLAPLRFCGRMCYSLYLTHPLVVAPVAWLFFKAGLRSPAATVFIIIPVAVSLSVALGWGFYLLVERRFLNSPTRHSPVTSTITYTAPESCIPFESPNTRTSPCPVAGSP